jgi:hypothetical protein
MDPITLIVTAVKFSALPGGLSLRIAVGSQPVLKGRDER